MQPQALDSGIDMYVVQCRAPTPHVTFISRSQTAGVAVPFALRRSDPLIPSRSATLFSIQTCGRDNSRLCDKACLCVFGPAGLSARLGTSIPPVVPPLPICGTSVPIASEFNELISTICEAVCPAVESGFLQVSASATRRVALRFTIRPNSRQHRAADIGSFIWFLIWQGQSVSVQQFSDRNFIA